LLFAAPHLYTHPEFNFTDLSFAKNALRKDMDMKKVLLATLLLPLSAFSSEHPFQKYVGEVFEIAATYCEQDGEDRTDLWTYAKLEFIEENTYLNPQLRELGIYRKFSEISGENVQLFLSPHEVIQENDSVTLLYGSDENRLEVQIKNTKRGFIYSETLISTGKTNFFCEHEIVL
jgi:hypothetical protein